VSHVIPHLSILSGRFLLRDFLALFFPIEDCFTDARHRFLGYVARFCRAVIDYAQNFVGMRGEFFATGADRLNPFDEVVSHFCFALDAADSGCAAAFG